MARINPLTSIKDLTSGALKVQKTVADKAVDSLGKVTGVVTSLVPGGRSDAPASASGGGAEVTEAPTKVQGDPLHPPAAAPKTKKAPAAKSTPAADKPAAKKPTAKAPKAPSTKAPAEEQAAPKKDAKVSPAKKAPAAKKSAAKESPSGKLPARKAPAAKAAEPKTSDSPPQPVNVVEELGLDPAPVSTAGPKTSLKTGPKTGPGAGQESETSEVTATPADVAAAVEGASSAAPDGDRPPSPS